MRRTPHKTGYIRILRVWLGSLGNTSNYVSNKININHKHHYTEILHIFVTDGREHYCFENWSSVTLESVLLSNTDQPGWSLASFMTPVMSRQRGHHAPNLYNPPYFEMGKFK